MATKNSRKKEIMTKNEELAQRAKKQALRKKFSAVYLAIKDTFKEMVQRLCEGDNTAKDFNFTGVIRRKISEIGNKMRLGKDKYWLDFQDKDVWIAADKMASKQLEPRGCVENEFVSRFMGDKDVAKVLETEVQEELPDLHDMIIQAEAGKALNQFSAGRRIIALVEQSEFVRNPDCLILSAIERFWTEHGAKAFGATASGNASEDDVMLKLGLVYLRVRPCLENRVNNFVEEFKADSSAIDILDFTGRVFREYRFLSRLLGSREEQWLPIGVLRDAEGNPVRDDEGRKRPYPATEFAKWLASDVLDSAITEDMVRVVFESAEVQALLKITPDPDKGYFSIMQEKLGPDDYRTMAGRYLGSFTAGRHLLGRISRKLVSAYYKEEVQADMEQGLHDPDFQALGLFDDDVEPAADVDPAALKESESTEDSIEDEALED